MNPFFKKTVVAVILLSAAVEWPTEAGVKLPPAATEKIGKAATSLFCSCARSTKFTEKAVNKAAQETERFVNKGAKAVKNNTAGQGALARRMSRDSLVLHGLEGVTNAETQCGVCQGTGTVRSKDGWYVTCGNCNGTGKVAISSHRTRR